LRGSVDAAFAVSRVVGGVVVVVGFVALIVFTMFAGFVASVVFVPFAVVVASAHLHVVLFGFGGGAGGMGEVRVVVGEMRVVAVFEEMRCQMKEGESVFWFWL
jgi:hypothetical protein